MRVTSVIHRSLTLGVIDKEIYQCCFLFESNFATFFNKISRILNFLETHSLHFLTCWSTSKSLSSVELYNLTNFTFYESHFYFWLSKWPLHSHMIPFSDTFTSHDRSELWNTMTDGLHFGCIFGVHFLCQPAPSMFRIAVLLIAVHTSCLQMQVSVMCPTCVYLILKWELINFFLSFRENFLREPYLYVWLRSFETGDAKESQASLLHFYSDYTRESAKFIARNQESSCIPELFELNFSPTMIFFMKTSSKSNNWI